MLPSLSPEPRTLNPLYLSSNPYIIPGTRPGVKPHPGALSIGAYSTSTTWFDMAHNFLTKASTFAPSTHR